MEAKLYLVLFYLLSLCSELSTQYIDFASPAGWDHTSAIKKNKPECMEIKPGVKDIVRRISAILPFFDRDHQNVQFLQTYRNTLNIMSKVEDLLDREAAFYVAVITPILFLHRSSEVWCVMDRLHQAMIDYKTCSTSEKRTVLKTLQNLRDINKKAQTFISKLPERKRLPHTSTQKIAEEYRFRKDNRVVKELIKSIF